MLNLYSINEFIFLALSWMMQLVEQIITKINFQKLSSKLSILHSPFAIRFHNNNDNNNRCRTVSLWSCSRSWKVDFACCVSSIECMHLSHKATRVPLKNRNFIHNIHIVSISNWNRCYNIKFGTIHIHRRCVYLVFVWLDSLWYLRVLFI